MPCSGCSALHGVNPNFKKKLFYSWLFTSAFISAFILDIIFYNFSELDLKVSINRFMSKMFFLTDSPKPPLLPPPSPSPFNGQNFLTVKKVFG